MDADNDKHPEVRFSQSYMQAVDQILSEVEANIDRLIGDVKRAHSVFREVADNDKLVYSGELGEIEAYTNLSSDQLERATKFDYQDFEAEIIGLQGS
jgi:hypothetical protein